MQPPCQQACYSPPSPSFLETVPLGRAASFPGGADPSLPAAAPPAAAPGLISDYFLRQLCRLLIVSEDDLFGYFLALDRKFFDATKITSVLNGSSSLQMAGFHLARGWHHFCAASEPQKLERLCAALEAVDKQGLEEQVRDLAMAPEE